MGRKRTRERARGRGRGSVGALVKGEGLHLVHGRCLGFLVVHFPLLHAVVSRLLCVPDQLAGSSAPSKGGLCRAANAKLKLQPAGLSFLVFGRLHRRTAYSIAFTRHELEPVRAPPASCSPALTSEARLAQLATSSLSSTTAYATARCYSSPIRQSSPAMSSEPPASLPESAVDEGAPKAPATINSLPPEILYHIIKLALPRVRHETSK